MPDCPARSPEQGIAIRLGAPCAAAIALLAAAISLAPGGVHAQADPGTGYIEMPEAQDGSYVLASGRGTGHHWGREELVRYITFLAREWRTRHPDAPRLLIGDMSKPDGSEFPPHVTHRDGLTLDLLTTPRNVCHIDWPDQDLTLELARLAHQLGARQILYNGTYVDEHVPVAQPWPNHDDHFHIVIDPAGVPADLGPLLIPLPDLADGAFAGLARFQRAEGRAGRDEAPGTGLVLGWTYLGAVPGWQQRFEVEVEDSRGTAIHASGSVEGGRTAYRLPVPLADGAAIRWRVRVFGPGGAEQAIGWQRLTVDTAPPAVTIEFPADGEDAGPAPTFRWSVQGGPQVSYTVEIGPSSSRRTATLGPFEGDAPTYAMPEALPGGRRYRVRITCRDAAGNEGASEWREFRVGR